MAEATHLLGLPCKHKPKDIKPQGHNSGLDADKVDGFHASELGGGGSAHQPLTVKGTTDASLSSTSFDDMPDMSINITTGNNPVLILFSSGIMCNSYAAKVRLLIDGNVEVGMSVGHNYSRNNWGNANFSILKTLSAGSHTIKVQWACVAAGATVYCKVETTPDRYHRQLSVIELKS